MLCEARTNSMTNTYFLLLLVPLMFESFENRQVKGSKANFDVIELSDGGRFQIGEN
jgi:hypothetical protein